MRLKQVCQYLHTMDFFFLGDLELAQCNMVFAWLHVHGRRHKALLSRDVGVHRLVVISALVISSRGGTVVQGSRGLVTQVLVR